MTEGPADAPMTLAERAASAALWTVGLGWLAAATSALTLAYRLRPAAEIDAWTRLYLRGQLLLTTARWRAEVHPDVRPDTAYVFCQNHVNVLDHCTMYLATPHFKQGIELEDHFRIPFYGPFMRARGTIPVNRDDPKDMIRLMRRAKDEIRAGHSLLVFPEGTRTRTGRVGPFHAGIFHVARALGAPVVPVAVTGMHEVQPTGTWRFRPFQEVVVHVMAPIPTAGLARDQVPALCEEVQAKVAEKVDAWYARGGAE
jgi:1-acyl-sn-glycerol-3-phosphate acyltransferase